MSKFDKYTSIREAKEMLDILERDGLIVTRFGKDIAGVLRRSLEAALPDEQPAKKGTDEQKDDAITRLLHSPEYHEILIWIWTPECCGYLAGGHITTDYRKAQKYHRGDEHWLQQRDFSTLTPEWMAGTADAEGWIDVAHGMWPQQLGQCMEVQYEGDSEPTVVSGLVYMFEPHKPVNQRFHPSYQPPKREPTISKFRLCGFPDRTPAPVEFGGKL